MNPFLVVERACAETIERIFAVVFPSGLEPVQIARRLVASLESSHPPPTRYRVYLHPHDYGELSGELADLTASWIAMLEEMARRLGLDLAETPTVATLAVEDVVRGGVRVAADPGVNVMRLRVVAGMPEGRVVTLDGEVVAGRAAESGLVLHDPSVSRRHAAFTRSGEEITVRDLGSANGTFVNGERVEHALIRRGDLVRLGNCEVAVE